MNTINKDDQQSIVNIECPYCGWETSITAPNSFKTFYAHCLNCNEKFVVEPIRDGIKVYTLLKVPYGIDPDCQAIEMGQCDEE
jgi:hypothetical protein